MNVPKIRFSNFHSEYEKYKFKDVATLYRGSSPRPIINFITKAEDGVNWIKIGDVSENATYINSTSEKITIEGSKKSRKVYKNDIILSNSMSFGRPYILNIDGCIHDGWFVVRDYSEKLVQQYLYHFMSSPVIQKQYKKLSAGGVVSNISSDLVYSVNINIPSKEEQIKVSNFLSLLDKKIELQSKKIEDLKLFKSRQICKLISDENCEEIELRKIGNFISGNSLGKEQISNKGVPFVLYGDLYTKYGEVIDDVNQYINDDSRLIKSKIGDLLFPTSTTVDAISLISPSRININGVVYGGDLLIFRTNNKNVDTTFLSYQINHYKKREFSKKAQGSTIIHIYSESLLNSKVKLPNINIQNKISNFGNCINKKIELEKRYLIKLNELKKGLMQNMFV